jgi:hypothetical protein
MNQTRLPKEVLPDWERRDKQSCKGDRVEYITGTTLSSVNTLALKMDI